MTRSTLFQPLTEKKTEKLDLLQMRHKYCWNESNAFESEADWQGVHVFLISCSIFFFTKSWFSIFFIRNKEIDVSTFHKTIISNSTFYFFLFTFVYRRTRNQNLSVIMLSRMMALQLWPNSFCLYYACSWLIQFIRIVT